MKKGLVILSLLFILFGCFGGSDSESKDDNLEEQALAHYTEAVLNFQNEDLIKSVEAVEIKI